MSVETALREGGPPLLWLYEAAAAFADEDPARLADDPGVIARSLAGAVDLFSLPAVCTSFDAGVEAGALDAGHGVETVDDAFDLEMEADAVVEGDRVQTLLDATTRLVDAVGEASVLGGVTGPAALADRLLAAGDPADDLRDETRFTAGTVGTELANAYLDRDADGIAVLEPDGIAAGDPAGYVDAASPLSNVVDHYDGVAVLVARRLTPEDVELAADSGLDAATGAVADPERALATARDAGIALGVGIPQERFAAGTADAFVDGLPDGVLPSSEWTVPAETSPETLHGVMGSL